MRSPSEMGSQLRHPVEKCTNCKLKINFQRVHCMHTVLRARHSKNEVLVRESFVDRD